MTYRTENEASITVGLCVLMVVSAFLLHRAITIATAVPVFVCALLFTAWKLRLRTAFIACVVAALCLDFFFTEPRYSLRISSPQDVSAICSFLAVVLFISWLSNRLATKTKLLAAREQAQRELHTLAERSLQLDWRLPLTPELCRVVRSCFQLDAVCIWDDLSNTFAYDGTPTQDVDAVRAACMAEKDFDLPRIRTSMRLLHSGVRTVGSISLEGNLPASAILGAIASLVALSMERAHALHSEVLAQSERLSEQIRSSVLDGLAHSIKTPLTTISVSSAGVQAIGGLTDTQTTLLDLVQQQATRISSLTNRLLRTARLDAKAVVKRREASVPEIIASASGNLEDEGRLVVHQAEMPPFLWIDPDLLAMAINQIIENALKYSPADSPVQLSLEQDRDMLRISVRNEGSFIPPEESERVFQRFYRAHGSEHRAPGTGLGLTVAKQAVEALGGHIDLASSVEAGTTFTIHIPSEVRKDARLTTHR